MDTLTAQGLWQKNVDLSALTSTRTGGCCDFFHAPMTIEALLEDLERARSLSIPVTVLGCMSNVLVSDRGIAGLVISTRAVKGIEIKGDLVIAACGERLDAVINKALDHNLAGLEELGGIPGTVGGATWGNAGANGLEVGDRFFYSDYITASGKLRRMPSYCDAFSYRSSPFEEGDTILCTAFRLQPLGATAQARVRKEAFKAKRIAHRRGRPQGSGARRGHGLALPRRLHRQCLKCDEPGDVRACRDRARRRREEVWHHARV